MIELILTGAGGLALFMLAMAMMTDGLKLFGGHGLKAMLRDWTSSPLRGVMVGALLTAIVQSSSAVTVATIGFVNAGILTLRQALGVVFGANLGTTMTGWLVSLTGIGFKMEALALPILALGVALKLVQTGRRLEGLGGALAGFGLFFLGLGILQQAFAGVTDRFGPDLLADRDGIAGILFFVGLGFATTVLTQSSSAAIAIVLTAATQSVISIEAAAAAVIGANVGTTSTALFAVLNATASARRVAVGHLVFNAATAVVALLLLVPFVTIVAALADWLGAGHDAAPLLALFHTAFNLLGVALMLPFTGLLADRLDRLFRSAEEDLGRPRHLDRTVLATPALALEALGRELERLRTLACGIALTVLHATAAAPARIERRVEAALTLGEAIGAFATSVRMESLSREDAVALAHALRIARYLEEALRQVPEAERLHRAVAGLHDAGLRESVLAALDAAARCVAAHDGTAPADLPEGEADRTLEVFQQAYERAKGELLAAAAARALAINEVDAQLNALSRTRRMVDQLVKGDRGLYAIARGEPSATPPAGEATPLERTD